MQQLQPGLLEDLTVNFCLLEQFHGSDLKPSEVNAKTHLFQEFADQFLQQQLRAIQTWLILTGVAAENDIEVLKM